MKKTFSTYFSKLTPWRISLAVCLGMLIGANPNVFVIQNLVIISCLFIFRIPKLLFLASLVASFILGMLFLDNGSHSLGTYFLSHKSFYGFFLSLSKVPLIALTGFTNSVTLGSALIAVIVLPVSFVASRFLHSKPS